MSMLVRSVVLCIVLAVSAPPMLKAQIIPGLGCNACRQPVRTCQCTALQPVVKTQLRPQRTVSYRDVQVTRYRREARVDRVPVTTYQDVVVDEGSYRQVWLPKPVRKRVARNGYQNRVSYRDVPYQVTQRVPQYGMSYVPQRTVQYVPRLYRTAVAPACNTSGPVPTTTSLPMTYVPSVIPAMPAITVRTTPRVSARESRSANPVPDPKFLGTPKSAQVEQWKDVSSSTSASLENRLGGYEIAPTRRISSSIPSARIERSASRFVPAPSAAMVWQTRRR
ncbi:MAG: hypothetical protein CMJ78_13825 [Planctomycetaceae bacterium]|nr:hypothetical protein [Planctomycetaceae bacterium]